MIKTTTEIFAETKKGAYGDPGEHTYTEEREIEVDEALAETESNLRIAYGENLGDWDIKL